MAAAATDRVVDWYFEWDDSYAETQLGEYCVCLIGYLETRGVESIGCEPSWAGMHVVGTYSEIAPVLDLAIIEHIELYCWDDVCGGCSDLSVDQCEQDAFCSILTGDRFDATLGCVWPGEPAGCTFRHHL